ncbi:unnamed protein product [Heligmosomoides polygyrus]|uniref:Uncharacterized protein n=1 Tax=Heligmosomoides polygyrus TaxID=6339 RepID=A0A183GLR9_HELPZ|nr:unnamed protein product [Heligmosomoides polygyrus]
MDRKMVLNRWRTYFEGVSTIEFGHPSIPSSSPVHGPVQEITVERTYFEGVSTIEFGHPSIPSSSPVHGPVQEITVEEVEAALKKMKPGKSTGPDDLAADILKSKFWY